MGTTVECSRFWDWCFHNRTNRNGSVWLPQWGIGTALRVLQLMPPSARQGQLSHLPQVLMSRGHNSPLPCCHETDEKLGPLSYVPNLGADSPIPARTGLSLLCYSGKVQDLLALCYSWGWGGGQGQLSHLPHAHISYSYCVGKNVIYRAEEIS